MKSHYVCAPLTEECRAGLKAVQEALASDAQRLNLRASGTHDINFTLSVFRIDEQGKPQRSEEQLVESINEVLKNFLDKRSPIELTFGRIGSFGSRIIYIEIVNSSEVAVLRNEMNKELKEEGLILADDRFTPHITLYRARDGRRGGRGSSKDDGSVTIGTLLNRTDLPPVPSSPIKKLILKRLLGH